MGKPKPAGYDEPIAEGRLTACLCDDVVVGFVDAQPGELTRLFTLPDVAGLGLGRRLLAIAIERARLGQGGPIRLAATINAMLKGFIESSGSGAWAEATSPTVSAASRLRSYRWNCEFRSNAEFRRQEKLESALSRDPGVAECSSDQTHLNRET
ncbi:GNAT family N-acetyltransferase [Bradyrhizobium barranii]|uniref:GNAT family N-acetyltransferase n=1 Tax=Bradyrhizobium barranii TaxID=2992140 RepID=UPI0031338FBA